MKRLTTLLPIAIAIAAIGIASSGCVVVKPWERDALARRDMAWEPDTLEATRQAHIYFSKEATMPGGSAGGGGCGCN
jgi:hypothetical protein